MLNFFSRGPLLRGSQTNPMNRLHTRARKRSEHPWESATNSSCEHPSEYRLDKWQSFEIATDNIRFHCKLPLNIHWKMSHESTMISEVSISGVQFLHLVTRAAVSRTAARAHTERLWVTRSCTSGGIGRQGTVFLLSFHLAAWTNQDFWKLYFWVPIICVDAQERQLNARRVRKVSRIVSEAPGPYDYLTYLLIYNELGNC